MDEREFGWDDVIENDGGDWVLLPEGEYPFTVKSFERKRFNGSAKLPPCNQAELTIEIDGGSLGKTTVQHSLFLHSKTEGLLCAFFTAIGHRKHGEPLRMNWQAVPGATGRCKVYVDKWEGRDGKEHESNRIQKFIEPIEMAVQSNVTAGNNLPEACSLSQANMNSARGNQAASSVEPATSRWKAGAF
ncbi:MAG TPA: DUF669 domain-containing protein [Candidatus Merdivicinus intestinigallinarum]|nr:DUF669 domain-containing protein [Candidatus Merdivicinus intestinigallinarum]